MPATSQLAWPISTTVTYVASLFKRDERLLKSFSFDIGALHRLVAANKAPAPAARPIEISRPPAR